MVYLSVDSVIQSDNAVHYTVEFLNTLDPAGLSEHILWDKVGTPLESSLQVI